MTFDQTNKIHELIVEFGLEDSKPTKILMEPVYVKRVDEEHLLSDNTKYRQVVVTLFFIATVSRPDISVAVNILYRRKECPRAKDWEPVKRTILYLNTAIHLKLTYTDTEKSVLRAYADSHWANDPNDQNEHQEVSFLKGTISIN